MKIKSIKKLLFTIAINIFFISIWIVNWQNIWDIQASFCEQEANNNEMNIVAQANKETSICLMFKNDSNIDTDISIDFVDWWLNINGNKSCDENYSRNWNFGQYILDYDKIVKIPKKTEIKKEYKIKFPIWFSWVSHWCLAFHIPSENQNNNNISMIFRKVHSIDILVGWVEVSSKIQPKSIAIFSDSSSSRLTFNIKNNWNIDQNIDISGNILNRFWYKKSFLIRDIGIKANEEKIITWERIILPEYKWLFSVKFEIANNPLLNFNTTNTNIKNEYSSKGIAYFSKYLIVRNPFYIISIATIILLISIIAIRKYKNK